MAETVRSLQVAGAESGALLEQAADLARRPARMDYPTEIKRWRAFPDQAGQVAKRWEQPPSPGPHRMPAKMVLDDPPSPRNRRLGFEFLRARQDTGHFRAVVPWRRRRM